MPPQPVKSVETTEDYQQQLQNELDQSRRAIKEIKLMLEQSQAELTKLTQRNSAITGHLQQVQTLFDTMPRADIRSAYNAALDAQQRLLVMRGQLEKLQSDQGNLQKYIQFLEKTVQVMNDSGLTSGRKMRNSGSQVLELVIKAQEAERQSVSRQMHEGHAQALSNLIVQTEIAARLVDADY